MARRKRKRAPRRRMPVGKAVLALALAAVAGLIAWQVIQAGGDGTTDEYLMEPAPGFTLPAISGDQVSLADHLGRHNVLLYFNEGMG